MSITFQKDTLLVDGALPSGTGMTSENMSYYATLQTDGNFVLYLMSGSTEVDALWATNLYNDDWVGTPMQMTLQPSGVLEVFNMITKESLWQYDIMAQTAPSSSTPVSQLEGLPPYHLVLTNEGVLGCYDAANNFIWQGIWDSSAVVPQNPNPRQKWEQHQQKTLSLVSKGLANTAAADGTSTAEEMKQDQKVDSTSSQTQISTSTVQDKTTSEATVVTMEMVQSMVTKGNQEMVEQLMEQMKQLLKNQERNGEEK